MSAQEVGKERVRFAVRGDNDAWTEEQEYVPLRGDVFPAFRRKRNRVYQVVAASGTTVILTEIRGRAALTPQSQHARQRACAGSCRGGSRVPPTGTVSPPRSPN